jgi:hypothetical protein
MLETRYEVIREPDGDSHGQFDTLDEARGCVAFDRLAEWSIYRLTQAQDGGEIRNAELVAASHWN